MVHLGDICKINGAEIEPVWCITGGSPCQDLSIAGKRAGLAGARSGLFMEQVRIVKEMREADKRNGRTGNMVVRRLTPLECTRLQGYPDGWVDIGDWVDEQGKTHKEADSPKYKALGNSIALPFWQWMIDRMAKYLPENATLGSLFDGIGGFALCFERTHGKGSARWASEIEPFPIAVTKMRFGEE